MGRGKRVNKTFDFSFFLFKSAHILKRFLLQKAQFTVLPDYVEAASAAIIFLHPLFVQKTVSRKKNKKDPASTNFRCLGFDRDGGGDLFQSYVFPPTTHVQR